MNWYNIDIEMVLTETKSSFSGLTSSGVQQKIIEYGPNQLIAKKKKPFWLLFLYQFKDFMILVLIAAAVIAGVVGDRADTIIILVIVLLNAIVGFVQEYRAEKAMEALKKMATPHSSVIRNGQVQTIESTELVAGDIVLLEAGNSVPADLRLYEVQAIKRIEASLTGESVAVDKTTDIMEAENPPLGDRANMAYKGTQVSNGRAKGIVVARSEEHTS